MCRKCLFKKDEAILFDYSCLFQRIALYTPGLRSDPEVEAIWERDARDVGGLAVKEAGVRRA